jgi:hypothetical protein
MSTSFSQSQSYFTTGGLPSVSWSWRQAPWGSRPLFFCQLNTCCHSPYLTPHVTRGWVCRLQLLLALASAVILRSESCGTHDHILLSQIRDCAKLEGQVPVFITLGTGFPFRRLLRLAGLRWRYSILPPHAFLRILRVYSNVFLDHNGREAERL